MNVPCAESTTRFWSSSVLHLLFISAACRLTSGSTQPAGDWVIPPACRHFICICEPHLICIPLFSSPGPRHPLLPWFQLKCQDVEQAFVFWYWSMAVMNESPLTSRCLTHFEMNLCSPVSQYCTGHCAGMWIYLQSSILLLSSSHRANTKLLELI